MDVIYGQDKADKSMDIPFERFSMDSQSEISNITLNIHNIISILVDEKKDMIRYRLIYGKKLKTKFADNQLEQIRKLVDFYVLKCYDGKLFLFYLGDVEHYFELDGSYDVDNNYCECNYSCFSGKFLFHSANQSQTPGDAMNLELKLRGWRFNLRVKLHKEDFNKLKKDFEDLHGIKKDISERKWVRRELLYEPFKLSGIW